jgi:aspartyl-tRNA(Asn)/glutamyl-tRNA(Gln) amidotransferase subunit A
MPTPRLSGAALTTLRLVTEIPWGADLVLAAMGRDHGLQALRDLPQSDRPQRDVEPRPIAAAPPRSWDDAGFSDWDPAPGSAAALRAAYAAGESDPVAVVDRIAERVAATDFGPSTHSPFVVTSLDRARAAASASAERYKAGATLGPLDGIPVPVKDEHHMVGLVTRGGTAYLDAPATVDSFVVRSLEAAGANVPGKTHTTEWGMNPWGMNPHFDMPRNVWRDDRGAGGSSTGSAVAVGLGLAPVAIGSDGGGSIRIPAALNGLYGLKPSFIRLGRTGDIYSNSTVSHIGPLGRSTSDLVDLMAAIGASADPDDPLSSNAPSGAAVAESWQRALGRGVRGCRIGVLESEWAEADPAVADAGQTALEALEREGAVRVSVDIPLAAMAHSIGAMQIATEAMGSLIDDFRQHAARMGTDLRLLLNLFGRVTAKDYLNAGRARAGLRLQTAAALGGVDVLVMPTTRTVAPAYALSENRTAISDDDATRAMCRFCFLGNLTGLPAGTVPVGMQDGLPIGLQIVGDAWDEASVLAVMAHCERAGISGRSTSVGWRDLVG